jgi:uncharacterized membrane protein YraQ (UPF0718 family)
MERVPTQPLGRVRVRVAETNRRWRSATISESTLGRMLGVLALVTAIAWAADVGDSPAIETFLLVFSSIVIEALPFILLGALASAAIAVYVPERSLARIARLPLSLQVPGAALSGIAFPVCECGSVPVARRLVVRGIHPSAAIAFMLAAPILNPIVLSSTWIAYGGGTQGMEMTAGRAVLGLTVAIVAGTVIGRSGAGALRQRPYGEAGHDHDGHHPRRRGGRITQLSDHLVADFLYMGKFIVLGAALSAFMQATVPQSALSAVGGAPVISALSLMGVAFVLSLCSEADAFVAASFTQFTPGAQLAFLVFGPVADLKLAALYGATFRRMFLLRLLLVAVPIILAGSLLFEAVT